MSPITPASLAFGQYNNLMPPIDTMKPIDSMTGFIPLSQPPIIGSDAWNEMVKFDKSSGTNFKSSLTSMDRYNAAQEEAKRNRQLKLIEEMNASGLGLTEEEMKHLKSAASKMHISQGNQGSALGEGAAYLTMGVVGQLGLNPVLNTKLAFKGDHIKLFKDLKVDKALRTKEVEAAINNAKTAMREVELRVRLKNCGDAFKGKIDPRTYVTMRSSMNEAIEVLKNAKTPEAVAQATKKLNIASESINKTISENCGYVKRGWKKYIKNQKVTSPTPESFKNTMEGVQKATVAAEEKAAAEAAARAAANTGKTSSKFMNGLKSFGKGCGKFAKSGALIIGFEVLGDWNKLKKAYKKDTKTGLKQTLQTGTKAVCATAGYLAGMKAGAAIGTAIGSVVPGIGNVVGFVAGAVIGGVGAFLGRKLGKWLGGKMAGAEKGKDVADSVAEENVTKHSGQYTTDATTGASVAVASEEQLEVVSEIIGWASQVQGEKDNPLTAEELAVINKLAASMQPAEATAQ